MIGPSSQKHQLRDTRSRRRSGNSLDRTDNGGLTSEADTSMANVCYLTGESLHAEIRIVFNQGEVDVVREDRKMLTSQARKLNNELRASLRRRETTATQQAELDETINELELECRAAEVDVRCARRPILSSYRHIRTPPNATTKCSTQVSWLIGA